MLVGTISGSTFASGSASCKEGKKSEQTEFDDADDNEEEEQQQQQEQEEEEERKKTNQRQKQKEKLELELCGVVFDEEYEARL